jgi:hypothetical protein
MAGKGKNGSISRAEGTEVFFANFILVRKPPFDWFDKLTADGRRTDKKRISVLLDMRLPTLASLTMVV